MISYAFMKRPRVAECTDFRLHFSTSASSWQYQDATLSQEDDDGDVTQFQQLPFA